MIIIWLELNTQRFLQPFLPLSLCVSFETSKHMSAIQPTIPQIVRELIISEACARNSHLPAGWWRRSVCGVDLKIQVRCTLKLWPNPVFITTRRSRFEKTLATPIGRTWWGDWADARDGTPTYQEEPHEGDARQMSMDHREKTTLSISVTCMDGKGKKGFDWRRCIYTYIHIYMCVP